MRIVVNGAGIAGPRLAYWLRRGGHEVVLVESVKRKQKTTARFAPSFAPKTAFGIAFRSLVVPLMRPLPFVMDYFIGRELRDQVQLPDHGW